MELDIFLVPGMKKNQLYKLDISKKKKYSTWEYKKSSTDKKLMLKKHKIGCKMKFWDNTKVQG